MEKKAKADAKRARRLKLKRGGDTSDPPDPASAEETTTDDAPDEPGEAN